MAGPITFAAFHQQTGGGVNAFQRYLTHYANVAAGQAALMGQNHGFDPTAPAVGRANAHSTAMGEIAPLLQAQQSQYGTQQTGLTNAITGFSDAMQKYLAPTADAVKQTYDQTGDQLTGTNNTVRDIAQQQGQGIQGQLAHFAQVSGQPVGAQGAADAGARTQVAGQVLGANGAADINNNTLHGEAARLYELSKPAAFATMGQQTLGRGLSALASANQTAEGDIRSKEPAEESRLYQAFLNRELQKAVGKATFNRYITDATIKAGATVTAAGIKARAGAAKTAASQAGKNSTAWKTQHNGFVTKANGLLQGATKAHPVYKMVAQVDPLTGVKGPPKRTLVSTDRPPNYLTTRKQLINLAEQYLVGYVNPTTGQKMTNADARQAAIAFLYASGLYGPGKYGRPGAGPITVAPENRGR